MNPLFMSTELALDGMNSENVINKAAAVISEYKNNPAFIEFWPLVSQLEKLHRQVDGTNNKELLFEISDLLFEIHLIELFQSADKKYHQIKKEVQKAVASGGPNIAMLKNHMSKFTRIESDYVHEVV